MLNNPRIEFKHLNDIFEKMNDWIFMQFTGLTDKNGKDVYEGDLIRAIETDEVFRIDDITPMHRHSHATNVGYFSDGKYHSRTASAAYDIHDDWMSWLEMYEVIGNIYENPELLTA